MDRNQWLAERFEENRPNLRAVAYRMLGSPSEADDAVQESWLRLSRSNTDSIENLSGWLSTVVARVCLDMLRSRTSRREEPLGMELRDQVASPQDGGDPEHEALLADSIGLALLSVLGTLAPAERVAFVLHDMFDLPFNDIADIVGRSPTATRQLASRARRRVHGVATVPDADLNHQRHVVDAFLTASRGGDLEALMAVLDPDVVVRADRTVMKTGAAREVRGAEAVAGTFSGRAAAAQLALVNGAVGAVWAPGGKPRVIFGFTIKQGKIVGIGLVGDPERVRQLDLAILAN